MAADPHKMKMMILGLRGKPPAEDGAPEGEEHDSGGDEDQEFQDAWNEFDEAMDKGDKAGACEALKAMIDIRIHGGAGGASEPDGDEG